MTGVLVDQIVTPEIGVIQRADFAPPAMTRVNEIVTPEIGVIQRADFTPLAMTEGDARNDG